MMGRCWKSRSRAAWEPGGPGGPCPGRPRLHVCPSVSMLSISPFSLTLGDLPSPTGGVDDPGNAHQDQPWVHTGFDGAFTDHGNMRNIGTFFRELTLLISRNILDFEVVLSSSSLSSSFLVIMSFKKKLNRSVRRC